MSNSVIIYMNKNEIATLEIPCTTENIGGYFPSNETGAQNGFTVINSTDGQIIKSYTDKVAVDYQHLSYGTNTIVFKALSGEMLNIVIGSVIPHDHASVRTGGPAFATYYSES